MKITYGNTGISLMHVILIKAYAQSLVDIAHEQGLVLDKQ